MSRTKPWEVSDELWERVRPLIPARPPYPKGGRPAQDDRQMLEAIVYVLRTGMQWKVVLQKCRWYGKLCFYSRTEEEIRS